MQLLDCLASAISPCITGMACLRPRAFSVAFCLCLSYTPSESWRALPACLPACLPAATQLAGGCAAPGIVNGPVNELFGRMQMEGKAPLGIDQVHATLNMHLARYVASAAAGPMAPTMHPEL